MFRRAGASGKTYHQSNSCHRTSHDAFLSQKIFSASDYNGSMHIALPPIHCPHPHKISRGMCRYCYNTWYKIFRAQEEGTPIPVRPKCRRKLRRNHFDRDNAPIAAALKRQQGRCAICRIRLATGNGLLGWDRSVRSRWMKVDHCHKSKLFRGLLCNNCNVLLGLAKDSERILEAALEYLQTNRPGILRQRKQREEREVLRRFRIQMAFQKKRETL